jgi:hypothetical protein
MHDWVNNFVYIISCISVLFSYISSKPGELNHYSDRAEFSCSDSRQGQYTWSSQKCPFQLSVPTSLFLKGIWSCLEHKANRLPPKIKKECSHTPVLQYVFVTCRTTTLPFTYSSCSVVNGFKGSSLPMWLWTLPFASVYTLIQSKHSAASSYNSKRSRMLRWLLCMSSDWSWWTAGLPLFTTTLLLPGFLLCVDGPVALSREIADKR